MQPNEPRDYYETHEGSANKVFPLWEKDGVLGLDWHVWNRGTSSLTVTIDGTHTVTIPAGQDRGADNVKFGLLAVTSSVAFTAMLAGVVRRHGRAF